MPHVGISPAFSENYLYLGTHALIRMDIVIPKHLETVLESLFSEQELSSWTVNGREKQTTVILRFNMAAPIPSESVKYKKMSQAQVHRDLTRAEQYRNRAQEGSDSKQDQAERCSNTSLDNHILDNTAILKEPKPKPRSNTRPVAPNLSPRVTRSKAQHNLNAQAKVFTPSPVPQVDGPTDAERGQQQAKQQGDKLDQALAKEMRACLNRTEASQDKTLESLEHMYLHDETAGNLEHMYCSDSDVNKESLRYMYGSDYDSD